MEGFMDSIYSRLGGLKKICVHHNFKLWVCQIQKWLSIEIKTMAESRHWKEKWGTHMACVVIAVRER